MTQTDMTEQRLQEPPHYPWRLLRNGSARTIMLFAAASVLGFIALLAATAPADVMRRFVDVPEGTSLSGSVWNGQAVSPSGMAATWRLDVINSVFSKSASLSWNLEDASTFLEGRANVSRSRIRVADVSGVIDMEHFETAVSALPKNCLPPVRIAITHAERSEEKVALEGEAQMAATECAGRPVPALMLVATRLDDDAATRLNLFARDLPAKNPLATLDISANGRAIATVLPAGSEILLGQKLNGNTQLEFDLFSSISAS